MNRSPQSAVPRHAGALCAGLLLVLLGMLFHQSLRPGSLLFSSDAPLGICAAEHFAMPQAFLGVWQDLNWVGGHGGSAFPSITYGLLWILGPLGFSKFYAPASLFVLGFSAWLLFRQLGFRPAVSLLGALAAALNSDFFSYACWGLGTHTLAVAAAFLACAALVTPAIRSEWARGVLAGAGTGMAVMEGFDSGAILTLYLAAFMISQPWFQPGTPVRRLLAGAGRTLLVAVVAALVAAQTLTVLVGTQIQGVAGMQQDAATRAQRWDEATTWSLPKIETLRTVVPGLFGYRMDTPDGGNYWGRVGESPGMPGTRHSGAGHYAGILVVLLAGWACAQSLRGRNSAFTDLERRMVWFWAGAAVVSLALAWGRHAPFYQFFYALPYFSTIRNPIKFLHPFSLSLIILFAFGLEALWRTQLQRAAAAAGSGKQQFKEWWHKAPSFDRRSATWFWVLLGLGLLLCLLYASSHRDLEAHLARAVSPDLAPAIAGFSLREAGWTLLFLALAAGLLTAVFAGLFSGTRGRWAGWCLGLLLVADLTRANRPWVQYWNFNDKYAANPVFDAVRARAYEHRVSILPIRVNQELDFLQQLYTADWLQHALRYFNIQSLDMVQDPRPAADNLAFKTAFRARQLPGYFRLWELTNTRYLLGLSGLAEALNQQADPEKRRFRETLPFGLAQEPGGAIRVVTNTPGPFALMEFTGALPRAMLFPRWEVSSNDTATLDRLADPSFDPRQTVLLAPGSVVGNPPAGPTNTAAGKVEFESYAPKRIVLRAKTETPAVLLLNDKHHPLWRVTVDGAPQPLLRANYLMRAVTLQPGEHRVEFHFETPSRALVVSCLAILASLCVLGGHLFKR